MKQKMEKQDFMFPANSEIVKKYSQVLKMLKKPDMHTISIDVSPEVVTDLQMDLIPELIGAAQHHPALLDKFLFCIDIKFSEVENSTLYVHEMEWKSNVKYYQWFRFLGECIPFAFFFLNDMEARLYTIAGDLLAEGGQELNEKGSRMYFTEKQSNTIHNRAVMACIAFMQYCAPPAFDAKIMIEALIADMHFEFEYEDIKADYERLTKQGMRARVVPKDN